MRTRLLPPLAACLLVLVPAAARADNTSFGGAYSLMPGATAAEAFLNDSNPERWYLFGAVAGRSYCVETQGGVSFDTGSTAGRIDTIVTIYRGDGTTVVATNDDAIDEPSPLLLSRACWIAILTDLTYVKITRFTTGVAFNVRVRAVTGS